MKQIVHIIFTSAFPSFAYASNMGGPEDLAGFLVIFIVGLVISFVMSFKRDKEGKFGKFNVFKFFGYLVLAFIFAVIFLLLLLFN